MQQRVLQHIPPESGHSSVQRGELVHAARASQRGLIFSIASWSSATINFKPNAPNIERNPTKATDRSRREQLRAVAIL
jgi:hypothetical protein